MPQDGATFWANVLYFPENQHHKLQNADLRGSVNPTEVKNHLKLTKRILPRDGTTFQANLKHISERQHHELQTRACLTEIRAVFQSQQLFF